MNDKDQILEVKFVNFPKKSKWDYIAVVLSLLVALISLSLYYSEITRSPKIKLSVYSPSKAIGKVFLEYDDSKFSEKFDILVSLDNDGRLESNSITLNLFFSPLLKTESTYTFEQSGNKYYVSYSTDSGITKFNYINDDIRINARGGSKLIEKFNIALPKTERKMLIFYFFLKGDFQDQNGLVYYDFEKQEYEILQKSIKTKNYTNVWNKHIAKTK